MVPNYIERLKIPHKPGIYIFKSRDGKVLYVGKAVDLYRRVSSYFNGRSVGNTAHLVERISSLKTIIVESELEALILEANLIKKYLPPFNIRLIDDKDYLYIAVTKEDFPKVITARKKDLKPIKEWFGPFPSATTVKSTLKQLRRVFPWCSNPPKTRQRPCFYYHIGLCPGACVGKISKADYAITIRRFSKFMKGQKQALLDELTSNMQRFAKNQQFEEAQKVKKIITGIEYLTQTNRVAKYLENPNFLEQENLEALHNLQKDLNLPKLPVRIEAYDISNIQGMEATGSMVVLTDGEIDKSQYRKFKIRSSGRPNDVGMLQEMMGRRLNHPEWGIPDLILIDGGRGQVRGVYNVVLQNDLKIASSSDGHRSPRNDVIASEAKQSIPIFGLAKRMEWLYPSEGEVIKLPKRSLSLRLLQKIRDESHRFAITYHRKLRQKKFGLVTK
ncbi:excinuclease ABC subunit UvrC [Candidatus Daviesbacteria bacterium]|nr:excinuclease ABC subunit UvrC [Candidatus Daviesbacteria bacterium]